jgi:hypothetical protein
VPTPLAIGAVRKKGQNIFLSVFSETMEIGGLSDDRALIELEVPGVDNRAVRCFDGQGDTVGQAVRNTDKVEAKRTDGSGISWRYRAHFGVFRQMMLLQSMAANPKGQAGAVYGDLDFVQEIRQGADMIFVPMS